MPKQAAGSNTDVVASIDSKIQGLIADINAQIGQLEQKKTALISLFGGSSVVSKSVATKSAVVAVPGVRRRGRPPGSPNKGASKPTVAKPSAKTKKKRVFSEATKQKLAASAKARWDRIRAEQAGKAGKAGKEKGGKDKAA